MLSSTAKRLLPQAALERLTEWRSRSIIASHPELTKLTTGGYLFAGLPDKNHISSILAWLEWAVQTSTDGGIPQSVNVRQFATEGRISVAPSYPETTGYMLCTLVYGLRSGLPSFSRDKLDGIRQFLTEVQLPSGAFPGPGQEKRSLSFDTGQALTGLVALLQHVPPAAEDLKGCIERAADWLSSQIESSGAYAASSCYNGQRSYYAQATIGLLHAARYLKRKDWLNAAARNADWVYRQRSGDTWMRTFSFEEEGDYQNLHGIAYSIRGLIDLGYHLERPEYVQFAKACVDRIVSRSYPDLPAPDSIPGHFLDSFNRYRKTISPTGMCQIAICAYLLGDIFSDDTYTQFGHRLTESVKRFHFRDFSEIGMNGLLPGSWPVTGPYMHCNLPNWPIKFFLDCLYMKSGAKPLAIEG